MTTPTKVPNSLRCTCDNPIPDASEMLRPYSCKNCGENVIEDEYYEDL